MKIHIEFRYRDNLTVRKMSQLAQGQVGNVMNYINPIKTMTRILKEIPCVISCQNLTAIASKSAPNSMTMYSMSFIQVYLLSMQHYDIDFGQVQVMEFPWHFQDNDGICTRFGGIFDQLAIKET